MAEEDVKGKGQDADTGGKRVEPEATFTQEQVDAFFSQGYVKERIERELAKERKKYADYDDLKAQAAKLKEKEDAEKSELEKLQGQLADEQAKRAEAEQQAQERLMQAKVLVQAKELGFRNAGIAWQLVDVSPLSVGDDGQVVGVEEALKTLAEEHPYLLEKVSAANIDATAGKGQRAQPIRLTPEQASAAEELNMRPEAYAALMGARNLDDYRKLKPKQE